MKKKTIGGFIAALRKANGMTQKDLANRLNVSDKTISRWERDDGTPDLSVVPVIAEIFEITCDELLCGERKSPVERFNEQEGNELTVKGEKQRQRLLKSTLSKYHTQTYIVMGVSVIGFIVALICCFVYSEILLGFLVGAIFFSTSIICQMVFMKRALFSVEDYGLEEKDLSKFRKNVIILVEKSIGVIVAFVGFVFPLIIAISAHIGISVNAFLIGGTLSVTLFLLVYIVICHFLNVSLIRKRI